MAISYIFGDREETREEELERTLGYYVQEMSAKEERIRNQKHKYEKQIAELNEKYETLERKYKRLKSKRG